MSQLRFGSKSLIQCHSPTSSLPVSQHVDRHGIELYIDLQQLICILICKQLSFIQIYMSIGDAGIEVWELAPDTALMVFWYQVRVWLNGEFRPHLPSTLSAHEPQHSLKMWTWLSSRICQNYISSYIATHRYLPSPYTSEHRRQIYTMLSRIGKKQIAYKINAEAQIDKPHFVSLKRYLNVDMNRTTLSS